MIMPAVAVVGGSLGGLTAALVLRDAGCDVTVYERSQTTLDARGAGIAVLEQTLRYPVERLGLAPEAISTRTEWVRFLERDGSTAYEEPRSNRFSAWNTIYRVLHEAFPATRYLLGRELTAFAAEGGDVQLRFGNGEVRHADLLVCAEGINSASRHRMLPEVTPSYAGYVGWRGTVPEATLTPTTFEALHDAITYQVLPNSHILVYPIPGLNGSVEPGTRLMNMVWYRNVPASQLPAFLTDREGVRREVSLPPNQVRAEQVEEMRCFADRNLAPPIAELVTSVAEPFVQAVFDIEVPRMAVGRACLVGDAAFVARPHAAAGTAKAAEDGWVLAEELVRAGGQVDLALPRWERRQVALGASLLARTRQIGDSSQFSHDFRPGDPRLVFGLYGPGR
ncbi:MAG: monooxygenase FAD-binding protein [Nocardioides sp.]|nr:monooxygenase FAD-binding protein [Nocardioides sp.]